MENKKAIVVYLDNTDKCAEELTWLYKTWILWEVWKEFDLVVYHAPEAVNRIPKHEKVVPRELESMVKTEPFWKGYEFVNSFAMFNETKEKEWIASKYDFILKTDCDVFLTKNILGQEPRRVLIGRGGYMRSEKSDEILKNIKRVQEELGLTDCGLNHVGASIFGRVHTVMGVTSIQYKVTKYLLQKEWKESVGDWPGWFKGVASMYGMHIAVNAFLNPHEVILYALDEFCWDNEIASDTLHIHAWHTTGDFSKHKWFKGEYAKPKLTGIPKVAKDYCLAVASHTIEELVELKDPKPEQFSVVIPTVWKSPRLENLLEELNRSPLVSEILLIDNAKDQKSIELDRFEKIKHIPQEKNIYVNPAWNLGVKEAKNELIALCNDDISFNVEESFEWIRKNKDGLGCVGVHPESYTSDRESIGITRDYHTGGGGWGCLIFCKKSNWIDIPIDLKIGYGDDWIAKTQRPHYSIKTKTKINTEMSTTSKSSEFNAVVNSDIIIWNKIFN